TRLPDRRLQTEPGRNGISSGRTPESPVASPRCPEGDPRPPPSPTQPPRGGQESPCLEWPRPEAVSFHPGPDWAHPPCPPPAESCTSSARRAAFHTTGFPLRIAVATVCGSSTTGPSTIAAAPAAWNTIILGNRAIWPAARYSV